MVTVGNHEFVKYLVAWTNHNIQPCQANSKNSKAVGRSEHFAPGKESIFSITAILIVKFAVATFDHWLDTGFRKHLSSAME